MDCAAEGDDPEDVHQHLARTLTPLSPIFVRSGSSPGKWQFETSRLVDDRLPHAQVLAAPAEIDGKKWENWRSHRRQ
jgi:hypothetical protein